MKDEHRRKAQIPNMHEQSKDAQLQESKERKIQNEDLQEWLVK